MLDMYTKATGNEHRENLVAGAWKFHDESKKPFGVSVEELVETAKELVNSGIGTGKFVHVFVRGTGHDELGICFMYELGEEEVNRRHEDLKQPYRDFFMRRHGSAFKGWDIGSGIDLITLAN